MKCEFCGKKIDPYNEICPECGNHISKSEKEERDYLGFFDFSKGKKISVFAACVFSLFLIFHIAKYFRYGYVHIGSLIISIALILIPLWAFFVFRKSYITVYEDRIEGSIPFAFLFRKFRSIPADEVKDIRLIKSSRSFSKAGEISSAVLALKNSKLIIFGMDSQSFEDFRIAVRKLMKDSDY